MVSCVACVGAGDIAGSVAGSGELVELVELNSGVVVLDVISGVDRVGADEGIGGGMVLMQSFRLCSTMDVTPPRMHFLSVVDHPQLL